MPPPPPDPDSPLCDADPLARALARLRPTPAGVDGSKLLFLAGQAARDRAVTFWRRAFLGQCAVLVAVGCAATLHLTRLDALDAPGRAAVPPGSQAPVRARAAPEADPSVDQGPAAPHGPELAPPPRPAPDHAYPPAGPVLAQSDPADDALAEYLRVRREVLTAGLGLLPDPKLRRVAPVSPAELERSLQLPPGVLTAPYRLPPTPPPADPPPE